MQNTVFNTTGLKDERFLELFFTEDNFKRFMGLEFSAHKPNSSFYKTVKKRWDERNINIPEKSSKIITDMIIEENKEEIDKNKSETSGIRKIVLGEWYDI